MKYVKNTILIDCNLIPLYILKSLCGKSFNWERSFSRFRSGTKADKSCPCSISLM